MTLSEIKTWVTNTKVYAWVRGTLKSWTMWFNAIWGTAPVWLPDALNQLPTMKAYMPDNLYQWVFVILVVGNVLLRAKTNKSLADK